MSQKPEYELVIPQEARRFKPAVTKELANNIVGRALDLVPGDILLDKCQPGGIPLGEDVKELARARGAEVLTLMADPTRILAENLKSLPVDSLQEVYDEMVSQERALTEKANKFVGLFYDDDPRAMDSVDGRIRALYDKARLPLKKASVGKRYFIIYLPTLEEAKLVGVATETYDAMCFRAYNRPWDKIETAQDIVIYEVLNNDSQIEIFANEGLNRDWQTHLEMSIKGQTPFANSTFYRNIGSEIFSAPAKDTLSGRMAIPYPLMFNGRIINKLILEFRAGRVVDFWTKDPQERQWIRDILDSVTGAKEVGELGFGTNTEVRWPVVEPTKMEKIGGSFHIALGWSLPEKEYAGREVRIDNGVRSSVHIDLVNMMALPWRGRVLLDDRLIQRNGIWLDPETGRPDPRLAIISAKKPSLWKILESYFHF